jgi:hypothetical protein
MNGTGDPELLSFSAQVLERHGGLVEPESDHLVALLPGTLARELEIPEETRLGSEEFPLLYGSPLLDRIIHLATREVPIVYGQVEISYLKKAGFEQLLQQDLPFPDGQARVVSRGETRTTYMILVGRYVALSDERKEGLIRAAVSEATGTLIPELEESLPNFPLRYFEPGQVPPHFPGRLEKIISSALQGARGQAEEQLSEFFSSMRRRLRRDVRNTVEYYGALKREMEESLRNPHLTEIQRRERGAKIQGVAREMESKIADLENKYQVQVTVTACAALRLLVPVVQINILLRYRKLERTLQVTWNPITRRLDPMLCEGCGQTVRVLFPRDRDARISLLCPACSTGR